MSMWEIQSVDFVYILDITTRTTIKSATTRATTAATATTAFMSIDQYSYDLMLIQSCSYPLNLHFLQMMVTILLAPGGHRKVMQAFDYFRAIMKEKMRFQMLMSSLIHEPVDAAYQVTFKMTTRSKTTSIK